MAAPNASSHDDDVASEIRRELHEVAELSTTIQALATSVQTRCEALSDRMSDLEPGHADELGRHMSSVHPLPAQPRSDAARRPGHENEPAALLAMGLAGEGMSRAQISEYLRDSFGMEDTDELLERVVPQTP